jgi:hypothetical protein
METGPARDRSPGSMQRTAHVRTASVLGLVALAFFGIVIIAQCVDSPLIGLAALGVAAIGFALATRASRFRT